MLSDIIFYAGAFLWALPIIVFVIGAPIAALVNLVDYARTDRRDRRDRRLERATNPYLIPRKVDLRDSERVGLWLGRHGLH